ncbi:MAG: hypothetical protein EHM24_24665 [Acidobacteria bacterium]|nr:MAG: hypothetical protein EHM24_24665 [Acidobacteriota bacterium]
MADNRNIRPEDEEPLRDEPERGSADEEFEDAEEDLDEEDDADDEDLNVERDLISDVGFTSEVGSEGGSRGDVEVERKRPRVMRGSESTTTGEPDQDPTFRDRKSGPGY